MSQAWDPWVLRVLMFGGNSSHSIRVQCADNPEGSMARILGISPSTAKISKVTTRPPRVKN